VTWEARGLLSKEIEMKKIAWHWTLAVSAIALAFAACTVTEGDDDEDGGTGATGGSGGATGGSGGGETGGTGGGVTGGTGGGETGGTGGGSTTKTCAELYPGTDTCSQCLVTSCCAEVEACFNETSGECATGWDCLADCTDADTYEECKAACDDGNFNVAYNEIVLCLEEKCFEGCGSSQ
jgi:hypothetical protein